MAKPQKENGFTPIANELLDVVPKFKFTATQLRIILVIWRYTYGFRRKGAKLSITYVTEATGISKRHVERELGVLIKRNIVTIKTESLGRRSRVLGFNKDYESWKPDVAPTQMSMQIDMFSTDVDVGGAPTRMSVQDARSTDVDVDQERKYLKKDIKEKTVLFESFYSEYPRKVSKKKAQEAWNKLCKDKDFDPDKAIENTINFAKTCQLLETETRFIPHPSTYLNQKRYEDYPVVDPEGLAEGKQNRFDSNIDFLRGQIGDGYGEQRPGRITDGKGDSGLSEESTGFEE